jgi:hypothetical protein
LKDTLARLGERAISSRRRLLGSGFFGNAFFGGGFCRADFALGFHSGLNGFGFTIGFSVNGCDSRFSIHDFGFDNWLARKSETSEEKYSGSASKQFGHWSFCLTLNTLPCGLDRGRSRSCPLITARLRQRNGNSDEIATSKAFRQRLLR